MDFQHICFSGEIEDVSGIRRDEEHASSSVAVCFSSMNRIHGLLLIFLLPAAGITSACLLVMSFLSTRLPMSSIHSCRHADGRSGSPD